MPQIVSRGLRMRHGEQLQWSLVTILGLRLYLVRTGNLLASFRAKWQPQTADLEIEGIPTTSCVSWYCDLVLEASRLCTILRDDTIDI
jgi:hypothetical protein